MARHSKNDDFSNQRNRRHPRFSSRDEISNVHVVREQRSRYARDNDFERNLEKKASGHRLRKSLLILFAILVVACAVAVFTMYAVINSRTSISDADKSLAPSTQEGVSYTLISGEYSDAFEYKGPDAIMVLRNDSTNNTLSAISLSPDTQVILSDGNVHRIKDSQVMSGDA